MNKALFAAGVGALAVGGLAYWYLTQKPKVPPVPCGNYTDPESCSKAGCYWYNESCHNDPPGVLPCTEGVEGYCTYPGRQICDLHNNLCRCVDPTTNQWECVEKDAYACRHVPPLTFQKCVIINGMVDCKINVGDTPDECDLGYATPCSCVGAVCPGSSWCCVDNKCRKRAYATPINADRTNMTCIDTDPGNNFCTYELDEPLAAMSLVGELCYRWGPWPGSWGDYRVYLWYNGVRTLLTEKGLFIVGDTGCFGINETFPARGIDAIEFNIACYGTNIQVDYFFGHLSF